MRLTPGLNVTIAFGLPCFTAAAYTRAMASLKPIDVVAAVEPPAGHVVAIAIGPFLNHLGPLAGEGEVDRLILLALGQAEGLLRTGVLVGRLARQIQHQPDALRLQRVVQVQRQVARRAAFAGCVAGDRSYAAFGALK